MNNIKRAKEYSFWLIVFLGLFVFRVAGQLIQAIYPIPFMPQFNAWQSGALPYPFLLLFQVIIIVFCLHIIFSLRSGAVRPNEKMGLIYLVFGSIYFVVMIFRLIAGLSFASDHPWLGAYIPTIFHIVLALFLLTVGFFHNSHTDKILAWLLYPTVMLAMLISHYLYLNNNVNLHISTYVPVLTGALLITFLEKKFPHRRKWLADKKDVLNDSIYMLIVQIMLPKFLGFFIAVMLLELFQERGFGWSSIWPHVWPIWAQALLMLITAEFLRYWLHRLSHEWLPLWQLHAVHHSPHKLYWMNVGRFHPVEKTLQYLFDALPFIVLGVSEEVLALYFVFYAVNGFFQHCNIELRLGFLNYIISGPELHRWHHSKLIKESNKNYGNNLIVWDLLFGTWFLPKNRKVDELGLINRNYPMSFIDQLKTPFIKGIDKTA